MRSREYIRRRRSKKLSWNKALSLFWDFYALNYMWFYYGGGMNDFYGRSNRIVPEQRARRIRDAYYDCMYELLPCLFDALDASCRAEFRYARSEEHFFVQDDNSGDLENSDRILRKRARDIDASDMEYIFSLEDSWADEYGGKAWGECARVLKDKDFILSRFNNDWGIYIDKIFDLRHNNGFALNKTEFESVSKACLDIRFSIDCLSDFLSYNTSKKVEKLIKTTLMYENKK